MNARKHLAILLILVLLFSSTANASEPIKHVAIGERLTELQGVIQVQKLGNNDSVAMLVLDEPLVISAANAKTGLPEAKTIQVLSINANSSDEGKRVQVTGILVASESVSQRVPSYGLAQCTLKASAAAKSVSITPKAKLIIIGETLQLTASVKPASANQDVSWFSSKPSVLSVENGLITALSKGSATITAKTKNGKKATLKISVTVPVTGVSITDEAVTLKKGKTLKLKAQVSPANASNKDLKWTTSNAKTCTVSSTGKLTAKKAGTATSPRPPKMAASQRLWLSQSPATRLLLLRMFTLTHCWSLHPMSRKLPACIPAGSGRSS